MHRRRETLGDLRQRRPGHRRGSPSGRRPSRRASGRAGLEKTRASSVFDAGTPSSAGSRRSATKASARAPLTSPQSGSPLAAAPPGRPGRTGARLSRAGPTCGDGGHVALTQAPGAGRSRASAALRASRACMAVGADRQRHAGRQPSRQVAQAVAEVGLGAGADHDAGAAASHRFDLAAQRMRGVDQLPAASSRPSRASHSIGRAPVAARQSSTSAVCSATWMWIGPANDCASAPSAGDRIAADAARSE